MVLDISNNERAHNNGYKYLMGLYPLDIHALSSFELTSLKRTSLMLQYDFFGSMDMNSWKTNEIDRYVCYVDSKVTGVAIRAFFEKYKSALDYEEYIIILADTYDDFCELFAKTKKRNGKYEIITFREKERNYICNICNIVDIHTWNIYMLEAACASDINNTIDIKPFSSQFIEIIKQSKTDETNPLRYYMFSKNGIEGYSSWVYFENSNPVFFASVLPYYKNVAEIKIAVIEDVLADPEGAVLFLRGILRLLTPQYDKAVLRVKNSCETITKILKSKSIYYISSEKHFHMEDLL